MCIVKLRACIGAMILLLALTPALYAKEAVPMAADPELEKRVNEISHELRCLVCQNQTIADSHADLAVDLKNQVRQMVSEGKTQDEIVNYMVQRYGDFVRYRPPVKSTTIFLWVGPFILLVAGLVLLIINLKKRKRVIADAPLSEEESDKLSSLLKAEVSAAGKSTGGEAS
ncbi:cytochrome c-type biogenesis protein [Kaarinaea lacus]